MKIAAFRKTYASGFSLLVPELELRPGEVTAVIGANGSGKSTLARVLAGLDTPDAPGRVCSCAAIGYLPQKSYAFRMSVEQNILLGGTDRQRFDDLTRALGLKPLLKQRAKRLSGGECARMALARLLMGQHALLVLETEQLLRDYARNQQCVVVLITHSLSQARRISRKTLFLHNGLLAEQGEIAEILQRPKTPELQRFLAFYGA